MGVPVTTTTLATSYLAAEYLEAMIGIAAAQQSNMPQFVFQTSTVDRQTLKAHLRFKNPVTAVTGTEGSALTILSWSPSPVTVTAGLEGFSFQETKVTDSIAPEVLPSLVQEGAEALTRAVDSSLLALAPTLTGGQVGSTGTAVTVAIVLQGIANLDANHADRISSYEGRFHPQAFFDLQKDIVTKNYGIAKITSDAAGKDQINISETIIRKNTFVPTANSGADYCNAIFNNQAFAMVVAQNLKVEVLPIPNQHMWSIDCTYVFGTTLFRPTHGVPVIGGISA